MQQVKSLEEPWVRLLSKEFCLQLLQIRDRNSDYQAFSTPQVHPKSGWLALDMSDATAKETHEYLAYVLSCFRTKALRKQISDNMPFHVKCMTDLV